MQGLRLRREQRLKPCQPIRAFRYATQAALRADAEENIPLDHIFGYDLSNDFVLRGSYFGLEHTKL